MEVSTQSINSKDNVLFECSICKDQFAEAYQLDLHQGTKHFQSVSHCFFIKYGCQALLTNAKDFKKHHSTSAQKHFELLVVHLSDPMVTERKSQNKDELILAIVQANHMEKLERLQMELAVASETIKALNMEANSYCAHSIAASMLINQTPHKTLSDRLYTMEKTTADMPDIEDLERIPDLLEDLGPQIINSHQQFAEVCVDNKLNSIFLGSGAFSVRNYEERKRKALAGELLSTFTHPMYSATDGYKMCLMIRPNGNGQTSSGYLSIHVVLMKGQFDDVLSWPFRMTVKVTLVCQDNPAITYTKFIQPEDTESCEIPMEHMNEGYGIDKFISHAEVESDFVKNDTLWILAQLGKEESYP